MKLSASAFISGIEDDHDYHRYRLMHGLVRADGIGEWARAIDEILSGTATQQLSSSFFGARKVFTERLGKGTWQYEVVRSLNDVLVGLYPGAEKVSDKVALRKWFQIFAEVRNKTRGHGAITPAMCAKLAPGLEASIRLLCGNNPIFSMSWAYLHRNLSGKYRVVELGGDPGVFARLKSAAAVDGENYPNGIYLWSERYRRVELVHTDLDASDFFVPNGNFRNGTYELHSLITDSRLKGDATPYTAIASERPRSETEGQGELDAIGQVFTNLPALTSGYVRRPQLETEVHTLLANDRHPIITLVGRGGIGKTSLALAILHEITETDRFGVIIWFSARDIDLTMAGAKPVQPRVVTEGEIAAQYKTLISGTAPGTGDKADVTALMAEHLRKSPLGATLFVFDNFETVRSPVDVFQWIDTNIRLPNKVMITSRFREFKADYPVEISGMEQAEAEVLVKQTATMLHIDTLIGKRERDLLIDESNGHPYVIKIILGEVANAGSFSKPSTLFARKEEILEALFERTYSNLTPMATRIFLTLCGWRSLVPQLAVEAALLRYGSEGGNPQAGIDQLVRMSLIERIVAADSAEFLEVPLTAALFGRSKLGVSPNRAVIESDIRFLQDIGATGRSGLKEGIRPRVETFFRRAARKVNEGGARLDELRPILEFFARGYTPAWLLLSELEQDVAAPSGTKRAAECIRRYLESNPPVAKMRAAWQQLVHLYRAEGDVIGGCGAFIKAAEIAAPALDEISDMANWLNTAPELKNDMDVVERTALFRPLASLMEPHLVEASATDLSRLAWLYLHSGRSDRAIELADLGLKREPDNIHCQRLATKLNVGGKNDQTSALHHFSTTSGLA